MFALVLQLEEKESEEGYPQEHHIPTQARTDDSAPRHSRFTSPHLTPSIHVEANTNIGCGKSTLFKILSHRYHGGKVSGDIRFNGKPPKKKYYHRDVSFVPQEDQHMRMNSHLHNNGN